jgi:threonine dehydrogenase-like Zn-dependent dehydrogenase
MLLGNPPLCEALLVDPGRPGTVRLESVREPQPVRDHVLVQTLEVGVCGTDRTIAAGLYGSPPSGRDALILGHEAIGFVREPAAGFVRGELVAATVRRPCSGCDNCDRGEVDACMTGRFRERGISGLDGFASELFLERPENLVRVPQELNRLGVLAEPMSVCERSLRHSCTVGARQGWTPRRALVLGVGAIGMLTVYLLRLAGIETWALARRPSGSSRAELVRAAGARYVSTTEASLRQLAREIGGPDLILEATGSAQLAAEAVGVLGRNGVLCLRGISAGASAPGLSADFLTDMVLANKSVIGSTNAAPRDWERAVQDLTAIAQRWPDALREIVGLTVTPERFAEALAFDGVKATIRFG